MFKSGRSRASLGVLSAAIVVTTALGVGNALAGPKVKDRKLQGNGTAVQTLYTDAACSAGFGFTVVGSENLSPVGQVTFVTKGCVTSPTTSTSSTITTAAKGDTFTSTETSTTIGSASTTNSTITGGTGRFTGVSGSDTVNGTALGQVFPSDPTVLRTKFTVTGTITY